MHRKMCNFNPTPYFPEFFFNKWEARVPPELNIACMFFASPKRVMSLLLGSSTMHISGYKFCYVPLTKCSMTEVASSAALNSLIT